MKGSVGEWEIEKKKDISLLVTVEERDEILKKIGYSIDDEGFLVDKKNGERVKAEDGVEINLKQDKNFALIGGTHNFVRNLAGFSQYLANKNALNVKFKEK